MYPVPSISPVRVDKSIGIVAPIRVPIERQRIAFVESVGIGAVEPPDRRVVPPRPEVREPRRILDRLPGVPEAVLGDAIFDVTAPDVPVVRLVEPLPIRVVRA